MTDYRFTMVRRLDPLDEMDPRIIAQYRAASDAFRMRLLLDPQPGTYAAPGSLDVTIPLHTFPVSASLAAQAWADIERGNVAWDIVVVEPV